MITLNRDDNYYRLILSKNENLTRDEAFVLNKLNAYRKYKGKSVIKILQERNDYTNNLNINCQIINTKHINEKELSIELGNEDFVKFIEEKEIGFIFRQEVRTYTHDEIMLKTTGFEQERLLHDINIFNDFIEKLDCSELDSYILVCLYETKMIYTRIKVRTKKLDDIRDDLVEINNRTSH